MALAFYDVFCFGETFGSFVKFALDQASHLQAGVFTIFLRG